MVSGRVLGGWLVAGAILGCGARVERLVAKPNETENGGASGAGNVGGAGDAESGNPCVDPDLQPIPTGAELEAEIERIAGSSFNVSDREVGEYCGGMYWQWMTPFVDATLSFRHDDAGGLELVASTPNPWLRIETSKLTRGRDGWTVDQPPPLGGCMGLHFEEELNPYWAVPERVTLRFNADASRLSLVAHFAPPLDEREEVEASDVAVSGGRDEVAPRLLEATPYGDTGYDSYEEEEKLPWHLPRRFEFSEAMKPGWSASLEDDAGNRWLVAESLPGDALVTGFELDRYFPDGFHWLVEGQDLAGNAISTTDFVGASFQAQAADFEGELHLTWRCHDPHESYGPCEDEPDTCAVETLHPIAGARSIAVVQECELLLRVPRAQDATTLRFQARVKLDEEFGQHGVAVNLRTLDVGSQPKVEDHDLDDWTAAPEPLDGVIVSQIEEIALPLPAGSDDVLVAINPLSRVWLDSMRTE
jgi:hypothetical protein